MDKSRRKNDLESFVVSAYDQLKPYATHIYWGVILVLVAIILLMMWSHFAKKSNEKAWESYLQFAATAAEPEDYEPLLSELNSGPMGARVRLTVGDLYLARAGGAVHTDPDKARDNAEKARDLYDEALKLTSAYDLAENATYGKAKAYELLAATGESSSNLEKAIASYKDITTKWPKGAYSKIAEEQLKFLQKSDALAFFTNFVDDVAVVKKELDESKLNLDETDLETLEPGVDGGTLLKDIEGEEAEKQPEE